MVAVDRPKEPGGAQSIAQSRELRVIEEVEELSAHLEPGSFRDLNQKRVKNQRRETPMELYSFW
jgi:hypothetical protein